VVDGVKAQPFPASFQSDKKLNEINCGKILSK